jgi:hypothetical protein
LRSDRLEGIVTENEAAFSREAGVDEEPERADANLRRQKFKLDDLSVVEAGI